MKLSGISLPPKYRMLAFATVMLLFVLLFYSYVLIPQKLRITELTMAKVALEDKNAVIQEFEKKHPDTNKYLAEIEKRTALSEAMLPNYANINSFLTQLEQVAVASGLQLYEIKLGQKIVKAGYQEYPLDISVRGSFVQTLAFLQKLNDIVRFNTIRYVSTKTNQDVLESRLTIVIYSYGELN